MDVYVVKVVHLPSSMSSYVKHAMFFLFFVNLYLEKSTKSYISSPREKKGSIELLFRPMVILHTALNSYLTYLIRTGTFFQPPPWQFSPCADANSYFCPERLAARQTFGENLSAFPFFHGKQLYGGRDLSRLLRKRPTITA